MELPPGPRAFSSLPRDLPVGRTPGDAGVGPGRLRLGRDPHSTGQSGGALVPEASVPGGVVRRLALRKWLAAGYRVLTPTGQTVPAHHPATRGSLPPREVVPVSYSALPRLDRGANSNKIC